MRLPLLRRNAAAPAGYSLYAAEVPEMRFCHAEKIIAGKENV
jgi:hypothetical protein